MYRCHGEEQLTIPSFTTPSPHPTEVLLHHVPMHLFSTLPGHIVDATWPPLDIQSGLAASFVSSTTPVMDFFPQLSTHHPPVTSFISLLITSKLFALLSARYSSLPGYLHSILLAAEKPVSQSTYYVSPVTYFIPDPCHVVPYVYTG